MTDVAVQASFNSGEWSPNLYARVDIQKYRSGAALVENFFVDYRGGASTRVGSKYVIQVYKCGCPVRLITFQASFAAGYVIEIGDGYMRFTFRGAPIIEDPVAITGASAANPCVLTIPGNNFVVGEWIFVNSVVGMTQLNDRYFIISSVVGDLVTIKTLNNVALNSSTYTPYISGGAASRIYTIKSPYTAADNLRLLKFAQSINQMVICHPNHPVYVLTLVSPINWTLIPMVTGATVAPPTVVTITTTLPAGSWNYSYVVTSIDASGQESAQSSAGALVAASLRLTAGSNQISWPSSPGAVAYNVYEATISNFGTLPLGVEYGFIGSCKGNTFIDSNIGPDFTQTPPIPQSPFIGAGIDHITVTAAGTYTTVPKVTFTGSFTIPPVGLAQLQVLGTPTIFSGGSGHSVNDTINLQGGVVLKVTSVGAGGVITGWSVISPGAVSSGSVPTNPFGQGTDLGSGFGIGALATATWGVGSVVVINAGGGMLSAPTVNFDSGTAAATAFLTTPNGNPTAPGFVQQRLVLGGTTTAPATFYMSKPGQYYNFDISDPITAADAVTGTLVSGALNTIKSILGSYAGMIILTDKAAWLVNGGAVGAAIGPASIVANPQSFVGASDVPPIVANYDILFVQSKGSAIRDLAFNIYFSVFTGTDISIMASHLFFGFTIEEWAWSEQPYYIVQAVRNDGVLLALTFLKEQDFVGWGHFHTQGNFKSITSVTEPVTDTSVDAVYVLVERNINGFNTQYIERFAERSFPNGVVDAWCVDCGLQYSGTPVSTFTGAEHLAGATVTGLADGIIIPPFTMPDSGIFTLSAPASKVTVGLSYTCNLQTLPLDVGEPSVQGKVKKIASVDIRVKDTLGLKIGADFGSLIPMKDLVRGNVSSAFTGQPNQVVTDLVSGDAKTILNPTYTVPGQYLMQQSLPYPATVLGAFPQFVSEDRR